MASVSNKNNKKKPLAFWIHECIEQIWDCSLLSEASLHLCLAANYTYCLHFIFDFLYHILLPAIIHCTNKLFLKHSNQQTRFPTFSDFSLCCRQSPCFQMNPAAFKCSSCTSIWHESWSLFMKQSNQCFRHTFLHPYIIGHYNSSVRIIDLVSHTSYVVLCVNFYILMAGPAAEVDSERQFFFFGKLFMAVLFNLLPRVFARNLLRGNRQRNTFRISFWDSNLGFSFHKPTHYLLDYCDYSICGILFWGIANFAILTLRLSDGIEKCQL